MEHEQELEKFKKEQLTFDLEVQKFKLLKSAWNLETSRLCFDVASNLRLLPKFNENDVDIFFSLFERVADSRNWHDEE